MMQQAGSIYYLIWRLWSYRKLASRFHLHSWAANILVLSHFDKELNLHKILQQILISPVWNLLSGKELISSDFGSARLSSWPPGCLALAQFNLFCSKDQN